MMLGKLKRLLKRLGRPVYHFLVPVQAGYLYVAFAIVLNSKGSLFSFFRQVFRREPLLVTARNVGSSIYRPLFPAESFCLRRPLELNDSDWKSYQLRNTDSVPESFALDLRQVQVVTTDAWVRTSSGAVVSDIWAEKGYSTEATASLEVSGVRPPDLVLEGTSACLAMPWLPNYYHWTLQAVPRFHLISKIVDPGGIDHWIVPATLPAYVQEWLHLLKIPPEKWIHASPGAIACERLIASSIPGPNRWIPEWAIEFLRAKTLPNIEGKTETPRIFYLSRNEKDKRRILNRKAFQQLMEDHAIPSMELDGKTVLEQAELFNRADLIISLHGAALTNLIYCKPGATLIEILPKNLTVPCYFKLLQTLKLKHFISMGLEPRVPSPFYRTSPDADVIVNLAQIRAFLERASGSLHQ
jgi:hypothetical protein